MMGEVQLQVELGCSTLPLWWSPRARAPVSGYALEGHVADAGVRCGTGLGYGYCSLDGRVQAGHSCWAYWQGSPYAGYGHAT